MGKVTARGRPPKLRIGWSGRGPSGVEHVRYARHSLVPSAISCKDGSTRTPMLNSEFRADEPRITRISRIEFRSIPNFPNTSFGRKTIGKKIRLIRVIRGFPVRIVGFNFGFRVQFPEPPPAVALFPAGGITGRDLCGPPDLTCAGPQHPAARGRVDAAALAEGAREPGG